MQDSEEATEPRSETGDADASGNHHQSERGSVLNVVDKGFGISITEKIR